MTDRQELHTMLDHVPDEDLDDARQLLKETGCPGETISGAEDD